VLQSWHGVENDRTAYHFAWLAPIMWNFGRPEILPVKDAYPVGRHDAGFIS
jgi:hypothetical protein